MTRHQFAICGGIVGCSHTLIVITVVPVFVDAMGELNRKAD
jgi:hypothetical protein